MTFNVKNVQYKNVYKIPCLLHKFTILPIVALLLSELTFTSSNTSVITYYCFVFQKKILDFKKGDEKKVAEAEA